MRVSIAGLRVCGFGAFSIVSVVNIVEVWRQRVEGEGEG